MLESNIGQAAPSHRTPGQIGTKLRRVGHDFGYPTGGIGHWCPACGVMHVVSIDAPQSDGKRFEWDGNKASPTILPDIDIKWGDQVNPRVNGHGGGRCHYIINAGVIEFLFDCTHKMNGQRVPLPDLPGHLRD